ncbi:hypothetical protein [Arthrobacter crystallopoietes]|uniref:Uncharacterized protein n=1 Tax=Crystallibacter crystallopoietes TaxID=37928 RepID=A0A1H0XM63_9MICC|nr:hypothetical protein [Arthrobacter crystallopoietes]SDQ03726.1 hypothetical protein SAMN04489742_0158 [Arthrobacter crystallopoietes]
MANEKDDKKQIGLTPEANEAIAKIAADHFGGNQQDAYRFAISYAIGAGLNLDDAPAGGYTTKYHGEAVESGTSLRDLFQILGIGDPDRPFSTAEKLAEIGVRDMARRLDGNETLADMLGDGAEI